MRYFIAINLIICAGIGYVLRNANPGESCNAEGIEHLGNTFPHFAIAYTLLMLFAFRRKSSLLMLLAGAALWRPLALAWSSICGHESYDYLLFPLALLVIPPLGIAYAYAGKNRDFACCIIYLLALLPALYFLR